MHTHHDRYDYTLSVGVAELIGAERQRCWRNAALAVVLLPELFALGTYIEGWIVIPRGQGIDLVEHGWCTAPGHGIVDPTIVLTEERDQPVSYFPGIEWSRHALYRSLPGSTLPLVCHSRYGGDGMGHSGYRRGFDLAWQRALAVAQERQLPQSAIEVHSRDPRRGITVILDDRQD